MKKVFRIFGLVDRSGSMQFNKEDHLGGLRSFIEDQKDDSETYFTLIQFDHINPFEIVLDDVNIKDVDVKKIDLIPRGGTPLLDAMGRSVAFIEGKKFSDDDQIILMVITDGEDRDSKEWTIERVSKAVKDKEGKWKILYLGANVDAFTEAKNLGINVNSVLNYATSSVGTQNMYTSNTRSITRMKSAYARGMSSADALQAANFTAAEVSLCANPTQVLSKVGPVPFVSG